jgi:uncharacterized protein (TIGR03083 family)
MNHDRYVGAVERETASILAAARAGPLDSLVPTCPDWTVADLIGHLGNFSGWWYHNLCDALGRPRTDAREMPTDDTLVDWYEERGSQLIDLLRMSRSDLPAWTWVPSDQTAGFIARRCANELSIHRYDTETARGAAQPLDAELAADGIEELFVLIPNREFAVAGKGETLHLHGTDRDDEWTITLGPDELGVTRDHRKGDLALRGAVSDLALVLYGRPPLGPVERFGDERVLGLWNATFVF